jgi:hypothetical protein
MRFRDNFTEEFFGVNGATKVARMATKETMYENTAPSPALMQELQDSPVSNVTELEATTDNTTKEEEPTYTIEEITNIANAIDSQTVRPIYQVSTSPGTSYVDPNTGTLITTPIIPQEIISGGGFGGGMPMEEEPLEVEGGGAGGGKSLEEEENKRKKQMFLWILLLLAVYLGYRYFKKK